MEISENVLLQDARKAGIHFMIRYLSERRGKLVNCSGLHVDTLDEAFVQYGKTDARFEYRVAFTYAAIDKAWSILAPRELIVPADSPWLNESTGGSSEKEAG